LRAGNTPAEVPKLWQAPVAAMEAQVSRPHDQTPWQSERRRHRDGVSAGACNQDCIFAHSAHRRS
jgi:hypothetical protein